MIAKWDSLNSKKQEAIILYMERIKISTFSFGKFQWQRNSDKTGCIVSNSKESVRKLNK